MVGSGITSGTWADLGGDAGLTKNGRPAVAAGDDLLIDADGDYHVELVWRGSDGARTDLDEDRGPAA